MAADFPKATALIHAATFTYLKAQAIWKFGMCKCPDLKKSREFLQDSFRPGFGPKVIAAPIGSYGEHDHHSHTILVSWHMLRDYEEGKTVNGNTLIQVTVEHELVHHAEHFYSKMDACLPRNNYATRREIIGSRAGNCYEGGWEYEKEI